VIAVAAPPDGPDGSPAAGTPTPRTLAIAAATGRGLFCPLPAETTLDEEIRAALDLTARLAAGTSDALLPLSGPGEAVTRLKRGEQVIEIDGATVNLAPATAEPPILSREAPDVAEAAALPRIVIDKVMPTVDGTVGGSVDGGVGGAPAFAAKRIVGQPVAVEADIFIDGHDMIAAELQWQAADAAPGAKEWQRAPMLALGNDRWRAVFVPTRIGRWRFRIEAWFDELASVRHAIKVKREAGVAIDVEQAEEKALLPRQGERAFVATSATYPLEVERPQAAFASWYELFPRSATRDPGRHGTLADVIAELPRIRDMGFDVVYFPPIHPIGTSHRKGRNNSLTAKPGDVGSPYAIGSEEGGHDALHRALGTLDDFRKLVAAARAHELEIALDFAIQCSPDHPWLKQHPEWFKRRPDGTIKYAENPPKKYEDIVNVDFYGAGAVPSLWQALRDVVLFWAGEGVKLFRVDNPHTKPLPFWHWLIADVRGRHPDVVFLAEAFTRPKMMYRLAKAGFSQSYTYFTWRNEKRELAEYLTELTTSEAAEFFRPHFFVNTPDINPVFLQTSGRPGFLIRAVLATTLSGLWGMYSGFEICEAAPLPGREEYLDSEKYEIRVRDYGAPGNIVPEITQLNRLRRAHPALQSHLGVKFYASTSERVLVYGKALPSREDMILAVVSLDPHNAQETVFELPLWEWQLPDSGTVEAEDLMTGRTFSLSGKQQRLRLEPSVPFALWRIWPRMVTPRWEPPRLTPQ
jgi:starch synthase (maltosyl-transferring)